MSKNLLLIGFGLMASSLARALKGHKNYHISVYNRSEAALEVARNEGLCADASTDLASLVPHADIIMLTIPLLTYQELVEDMVPHMKEGAIITDVGSVKHAPLLTVLHSLPYARKSQLVGAHPIAGIEKSGAEAGFAELYAGKYVIMTPMPITRFEMVEEVEALWQAAGAKTRQMDVREHDAIFALASHAVQFSISAFGLFLAELSKAKRQSMSDVKLDSYQQFTRLLGSDARMWTDIAITNRRYVVEALETVLDELEFMEDALSNKDQDRLSRLLVLAIEKRADISTLMPKDVETAERADCPEPLQAGLMWLPMLISASLQHAVLPSEYPYAYGSGFLGATAPLKVAIPHDAEAMLKDREAVLEMLSVYTMMLKKMVRAIDASSEKQIFKLLDRAKNHA